MTGPLAWLTQGGAQRRALARLKYDRDALAAQAENLRRNLATADGRRATAMAELDAARNRPPPPVISERLIILACDDRERLAAVQDCLSLLTPVAAAVPKKRFGREFDGGYVLADLHGDPRCAISLGIGDDDSFDRDLLAAGYAVHQFDHSVEAPATPHPGRHFNKVRVMGSAAGPGEATLDAIVGAMTGPASAPNSLLLKCDIAGEEWDLLKGVRAETLAAFSQIVIELHWLRRLHDAEAAPVLRTCLEKLTLNHAPIHVHGNNYSQLVTNTWFAFPNVLEVTLLRRDLLAAMAGARRPCFPTELDRPNNPAWPDFYLGPFAWRAR